jgi:hypothetical protein
VSFVDKVIAGATGCLGLLAEVVALLSLAKSI